MTAATVERLHLLHLLSELPSLRPAARLFVASVWGYDPGFDEEEAHCPVIAWTAPTSAPRQIPKLEGSSVGKNCGKKTDMEKEERGRSGQVVRDEVTWFTPSEEKTPSKCVISRGGA